MLMKEFPLESWEIFLYVHFGKITPMEGTNTEPLKFSKLRVEPKNGCFVWYKKERELFIGEFKNNMKNGNGIFVSLKTRDFCVGKYCDDKFVSGVAYDGANEITKVGSFNKHFFFSQSMSFHKGEAIFHKSGDRYVQTTNEENRGTYYQKDCIFSGKFDHSFPDIIKYWEESIKIEGKEVFSGRLEEFVDRYEQHIDEEYAGDFFDFSDSEEEEEEKDDQVDSEKRERLKRETEEARRIYELQKFKYEDIPSVILVRNKTKFTPKIVFVDLYDECLIPFLHFFPEISPYIFKFYINKKESGIDMLKFLFEWVRTFTDNPIPKLEAEVQKNGAKQTDSLLRFVIDTKNDQMFDVFMANCDSLWLDLSQCIGQRYWSPDRHAESILIYCIRETHDYEKVRKLVECPSVSLTFPYAIKNAGFECYYTPIQFCYCIQRYDFVKLLYDNGADISPMRNETSGQVLNCFCNSDYKEQGSEELRREVEKIHEIYKKFIKGKRWNKEYQTYYPLFFRRYVWSLLLIREKISWLPDEIVQEILCYISLLRYELFSGC